MGLNYQLTKEGETTMILLVENSADTYLVSYVDLKEYESLEEKEMTKDTAFELLSDKANAGYTVRLIAGM